MKRILEKQNIYMQEETRIIRHGTLKMNTFIVQSIVRFILMGNIDVLCAVLTFLGEGRGEEGAEPRAGLARLVAAVQWDCVRVSASHPPPIALLKENGKNPRIWRKEQQLCPIKG